MFDLFDLEPVDYDPFVQEVADKSAPMPPKRPPDLGGAPSSVGPVNPPNALGMGTAQPLWWALPPAAQGRPAYPEGAIIPTAPTSDDGYGVRAPPDNALNLWDKFERVPQQVRSGVVPPAEIFVDPKTKKRWLMQVKNTGTDI